MTEVMMRKEYGALRPDSEDAFRVVSKIKDGQTVVVDIRDPSRRSTDQHRFAFALINQLYESQDYFKTFDHYRKCLLIALGRCDLYRLKDGTIVPIAHSLKFGSMPQDEFNDLVEEILVFATDHGFDRDQLLANTRDRAGMVYA